MDSEYRKRLLSLQGRLTCIQSELTDLVKEADTALLNERSKVPHRYIPWSSRINHCSICGNSKNHKLHSESKTNYLPHDYLQGKGAVCRICGELKDNSVHIPKVETPIQRQHTFCPYDTHPTHCSICGYHKGHKLHTPVWRDITRNCTLVMKESTWPPAGRTYGSLIYNYEDIAHLIADETHYPVPPGPNDGLIRGEAHLILALVDREKYRVRIQKRCWGIQRRSD